MRRFKLKNVLPLIGGALLLLSIYNSVIEIGPLIDWSSDEQKTAHEIESEFEAPAEFQKYLAEISIMEGQSVSGYSIGYRSRAMNQAQSDLRNIRTKNFDWVERGPGNVPGRTRGLIILPDDPTGKTWLAGTASGGIWKTEDGGQAWQNKTPDLPNLSTSTLAMSASNTSIIYAGTGEGFGNTGAVAGDGIFKSLDGGETWNLLESTTSIVGLGNVNRIIVDPTNADIILACGNGFPPFESGIYKSVDGGISWTQVYSATTRLQQIIADPTNFNIIYGTLNGQGIIKSEDGGDSWNSIGVGLFATGRIELTVSPTNPSRLYAAAESNVSGNNSALFLSEDGGNSWNSIGSSGPDITPDWLGDQGWYDNSLAVSPFNEDIIYVGGINMFKVDVTSDTQVQDATVTGVLEDGTLEFMDWVNAGLSFLRGGFGTSEEWFDDNEGFPIALQESDFTSVEIRFGPGVSQMAHRFTVPTTSGVQGNGGPGVEPLDHNYQDYVEVPFEVWDVENNRQLMVSFRDQERDGEWNLITRSNTDPVPGREYIFVNAVPYDPSTPDPNITVDGGHGYKTLYCMWPTLADEAEFDSDNLPDSKISVVFEEVIQRIATSTAIVNTNGTFNPGSSLPHPDFHNIQTFSSQNGTYKLIVATDGGIYESLEEASPGEQVSDWTGSGIGYNTTQFYGVDKAPESSEYIGGTQDNGTWVSINSDPSAGSSYSRGFGGDGFQVAWNYQDRNLLLGGSQFNNIRMSTNGGVNWQSATNGLTDTGDENAPFITKIETHKRKPSAALTVGRSGVWETSDYGASWSLNPISNNWVNAGGVSSAQTVKYSQADPIIIWAGGGMTSERSLHVSINGGSFFTRVQNIADTLGSISGLATHPYERETAYVLFSFAEFPKVFRTRDLGVTWEDLSGFEGGAESTNGFPDVRVHDLLVLPYDPSIPAITIWVATEIGIFESEDDGESWHLLNSNLPSVSVFRLKAVDDQVVAATHGRGIWTATIDGMQWPNNFVTSIEEEFSSQIISIYPNPASNLVKLKYKGLKPGPAEMSIKGLDGRTISQRSYLFDSENGIEEFEVGQLANGIYILSVDQDRDSFSTRLIVNH